MQRKKYQRKDKRIKYFLLLYLTFSQKLRGLQRYIHNSQLMRIVQESFYLLLEHEMWWCQYGLTNKPIRATS